MTHVFIFNNASRAANYGIGTYVRQISDGLAILPDYTVSFVEMHADTKEFSITEDDSGKLHYQIPAMTSGVENESYCRSIYYFLARNIETAINAKDDQENETAHKIIFQFNYFQHLSLAALLKGQFPESRIILTVHYLSWCFELKGNLAKMRKIKAKGYTPADDTEKGIVASIQNEKAFMHLADEVLVMSRETMSIVLNDYEVSKDKLHLIYNGFNNELAPNEATLSKNVLFVGRLDEIKGLKYLIDAFVSIAPKHADANLVIAGDGDFLPYLAQCRSLPNRITFLGKLQSDEVEQWYKTAYVGVMPSFHEQCSYTAIEMMRHGIPVIGTDSTGLGEMLDNTPELRVHIKEDEFDEKAFTEQIAKRIDLILSDENEHKRASEAVKLLYTKRYCVADMTEAIQRAANSSFQREDYAISPDYIKYMDSHIVQLIMKQPDIDTDFFGLSGIGIYLWWRIQKLAENRNDEYQLTLLQEYFIYYLDWLHDVSTVEDLPIEMIMTLNSIERKGFYKTRVIEILQLQTSKKMDCVIANDYCDTDIIKNTLKICNCKI